MTIDRYINPDFDNMKKLIFLGMAFAGIFLIILIIMFGTRMSVCLVDSSERHDEFKRRNIDNIQLFFEMIISGTSVLLFACSYVVCNHIFELLTPIVESGNAKKLSDGIRQFYYIWDTSKDFVLLFLISMSCLINTILDKIIIPLRRISKDDKASVRMLGMFYAIIILLSFNSFNAIGDKSFDTDIYSPIMMYYFGLMIGRFVYFDASFMDFICAILGAIRHGLLLVFAVVLSGLLSFIGFKLGYLIEQNFYIVGVLYTDIFLIVAIFIIHHFRALLLFIRNESDAEYEEYDDYDDEYEEEDEEEVRRIKRKKKAKKEKAAKKSQQEQEKRKEYASYGGYDNSDYDDFDV